MSNREVVNKSFIITNPQNNDECLSNIHSCIAESIFRELICKERPALRVKLIIEVIEEESSGPSN